MRNPAGLRSESTRTPNASRAGALHSHIHIHRHRQSHPCLSSHQSDSRPVDNSRPQRARRMDGGFAARVVGGGQ